MKKLFLFLLSFAFLAVVAACNLTPQKEDPKPDDPSEAWYETDGDYTFNDYLSATSTLNWNPLSWETSDDSAILAYQTIGFYDYKVNDTADNWEVVCEMASALPTDVTASFIGQYGIVEGDTAKAWSIPLNRKAKWSNGQEITAKDYIYSMKQQLDPEQLNRRADSFYGGDFSIYNAQNYLYNGKFAYPAPIVSAAYGDDEYYSMDSFLKDEDAGGQYYVIVDGEAKYVGLKLTNGGNWSSNSITDYQKAGYLLETGEKAFAELKKLEGTGKEGITDVVPINDTTVKYLQDIIANLHNFDDVDAYADAVGDYAYIEWQEMAFFGQYNDKMSFDEVGLFATDDYNIVIVLERKLPNPDFYLPYYLSSTWLVNEELYEASWSQAPDGTKTNTYMTTVATSISYGPYKLVSYTDDKGLSFERNTEWYGYTDGKHVNAAGEHEFQTDKINIAVYAEHSVALMAFLNGDIDGVGLDSDDMTTYGSSKYILYTPQSYTTKFTFITDADKLKARETDTINKVVLTNETFRHAISLAIDRASFTSQFTAAAAPGYGLINYMYEIFDDEGGEVAYRNLDVAKEALVSLYGLEYGAGKRYADLDEAYAAITGYDMDKAKELMQQAYDECVASGLYDPASNKVVTIELSVYLSDTVYDNMYLYVKNQVEEAVRGTSFEGKVTVSKKVDADYYNSAYAGKTDLIFSTWGGATYGTLGLLSRVYCDDYTGNGNQMEVGFNTDAYSLTLEIAGVETTASLKSFADWLNGEKIVGLKPYDEYSYEVQAYVLAAIEKEYLSHYCAIPLYYRQSASLYSQKVKYAASTYINLVGFGGIREIKYNYNDSEWEALVKAGQLKY